jgi:hypothetical protein
MKTDIRFCSDSAHSSQNENFRTEVVEKIKTRVLRPVTSFPKPCRLRHNTGKRDRTRQTTDDNTLRRIRFGCSITRATNTHSDYVILTL